MRVAWLPIAAAYVAVCSASAGAVTPAPQAMRSASGRVSFTRGETSRPLAGAWVTLHRVGRDSAGPVDSVRTDATGGFRFRYRPWGDTSAVYFVSSRYAGIAYFSSRLTAQSTAPGDADLSVYDTTSLNVPIDVASRHLVVSAPDTSGSRQVVEVYVLLNGSGLTRIAGRASAVTFESELPTDAFAPRAGEGDVPAQAMEFTNGRMRITAPLAPGTKRISYSYRLPSSLAEMAFPALASSDVLEVMVEDSAGTAAGVSLHEEAAVVVAGRTFRRYIGHDVPASQVVRVRAPGFTMVGAGAARALAVLVAAALMVAALARAMWRGATSNTASGAVAALAPPSHAD